MTKRMLIDASHAEETRVVVLDGNRLEDFDFETASRRQLKGNIYLAKVVRVEPSLQAAFVDYGGNRHGFLAFSEIHPDYYQIPVADRQRLLAMQAEDARAAQEQEDREAESEAENASREPDADSLATVEPADLEPADAQSEEAVALVIPPVPVQYAAAVTADLPEPELAPAEAVDESGATIELLQDEDSDAPSDADEETVVEEPPPEVIGGETDTEEQRERHIPPRFLRQYKIQEVIHRRQILLVQVVKEERGTKGAALTSYISLAGRYCVLMPNSPRGGGVSRKITSPADRRRLKEVIEELDLPDGMGLIVRTAGANRPKPEIKRDCEYLLRLWDDVRDHTLKSIAPTLIYEEASLIKRAIRDVYSRDIDEIMVDGEDGWKAARDFMRMLMPSHVKKVQLWRDAQGQPLFARHQVDAQLDAILSPIVQLRSGGYLVINQAEALVAIDVNSGRSTRERGIEETALRTNSEAAEEVARQLRLRDLAGLIVIDFIDMETRRHNAMVERRLKEALKADRARIQVGHISHFGLLEMSRQRLRPSLAETSFVPCPHCGGTGHIRTVESAAIQVLRAIEEEGGRHRAAEIVVHTTPAIAMYIFNHKRQRLLEVETRYTMRVVILTQEGLVSPVYRIERVRAQAAPEPAAVVTPDSTPPEEPEERAEPEAAEAADAEPTSEEDGDARRRRRRRRRRGGRREDGEAREEAPAPPVAVEGVPELAEGAAETRDRRNRRRRRGPRRDPDVLPSVAAPGADQPDVHPIYTGPTPADPFGGQAFDIFDVMEMAEQAEPVRQASIEIAPRPEPPATPPRAPEPVAVADPKPAARSELDIPPPPSREPATAEEPAVAEAPEPANDPEPLVKPIIVGAEEQPVEKKRGWWRH